MKVYCERMNLIQRLFLIANLGIRTLFGWSNGNTKSGAGRRPQFVRLAVETLEARVVPATMQTIGVAMNAALLVQVRSHVFAPVTTDTPSSIQTTILVNAANDLERAYDTTLLRGAEYAEKVANTGIVPKMMTGYTIDFDSKKQQADWVGRVSYSGKTAYAEQSTLLDRESGYWHLDDQFAGDFRGAADTRAVLEIKWAIDTFNRNGVLSTKVVDGSFVELADVRATSTLAGRGRYAWLSDVSMSGSGTVTGSAKYMLVSTNAGGVRARSGFNLASNFVTTVVSNDVFSKGVTWTISDSSRLAGSNDLRQPLPIFTAPSALSLLRAAVNGLNAFRVDISSIIGSMESVLKAKVPFTNKRLAESLKIPTSLPLAFNTVNLGTIPTFDALKAAILKDKRFSLFLAGEAQATSFAQGHRIDILAVRVQAEIITESVTLVKVSQMYMPFPGVIAEGSAELVAGVQVDIKGWLKLDTSGLGVQEGSKVSATLKLSGSIEGSVDILGTRHFSLIGGSVKAGMFVAGVVTITLGRPVDAKGNPTGTGVWYVGAAGFYNAKRPLIDFVRLDVDLRAGVEISVKVRVLGMTVWKAKSGKTWVLMQLAIVAPSAKWSV